MNLLLALLLIQRANPIVVSMVAGPANETVLVGVDRGTATVVARGGLGSLGPDFLTVVSDGRRLVALAKRDRATSLGAYRVTGGKFRFIGPLRAPRQVGALAMTADGRCLAGTLLGQVVSVLPYVAPKRERTGEVARSVAELVLSDRGTSYALRVENGGLGDTVETEVFSGRCLPEVPTVETGSTTVDTDPPCSDATYVAARRETWSFNGTGAPSVSRGLDASVPAHYTSGRNPPAKAVRAIHLDDGRWVVGDVDGTLTLGRYERGTWQPGGRSSKLSEPIGPGTYLRKSRDGCALVVASDGSGTIWWVPILGAQGLDKAKKVYQAADSHVVSISY